MVKAVNEEDEKKKNRQPAAVFCPNCGVPKSTSMKLAGFLAKKKKLRFYCTSCNLKITITSGWGKSGQDDFGIDVTAKDVLDGAKTGKKLIGILGGL